jgi:hypothetical protein
MAIVAAASVERVMPAGDAITDLWAGARQPLGLTA